MIDDDESGDLNRAEMQAALDLIEPILGAAADGGMQALKDAIDGFDVAAMMGGGGGGMDPSAWGRRRLADDAAPVRMAVGAQGAKVQALAAACGCSRGAAAGARGRRRRRRRRRAPRGPRRRSGSTAARGRATPRTRRTAAPPR